MAKERFYLHAYGCQMNLYDAGVVREILQGAGYAETGQERDADLILLLTCSVRKHAEQRALGRLQNLRGLKKQNPDLILALLGCTAQQRGNELVNGLGADLALGPDDYRLLPDLIQAFRTTGKRQVAVRSWGHRGTRCRIVSPVADEFRSCPQECYEGILPRHSGGVTGMISIMRGCNNYCAYCIVPYVRGPERSKSAKAVLAEVEHLLAQGVKDVTLVSQNVLAYKDGATDFCDLLRMVEDAGAPRIRFITSHPKDVDERLAQVLAGLEHFCPHIHLPFQSGSDRVLQAMNRRYTREDYLTRVDLLRRYLPELSVTTDVLVGFPGESDEDFAQTMEIMERVGFDFAYMFRYSERPGTRAAALEPKVPEAVAAERLSHLIGVQNRITRTRARALVGQQHEVLVEVRRGASLLARTRTNRVVALSAVRGHDPESKDRFGSCPLGAKLVVEIKEVKGWTPVGEPVGVEP